MKMDIASELQKKYDDIQNALETRDFFQYISNYGECLAKHDNSLSHLIKPLYEKGEQSTKEYINKLDNYLHTWAPLAVDLIELATQHNIQDHTEAQGVTVQPIAHLKKSLENIDKNKMIKRFTYFTLPYNNLLSRFRQSNLEDVLIPKHLLSRTLPEATIPKYTLYEQETTVGRAWDKYYINRKVSEWWAHYIITQYSFKEQPYIFKEKFKYIQEDELVLFNNNSNTDLKTKDQLQMFASRIHYYLTSRLNSQGTSQPIILECGKIRLNINDTELQYDNNKPINVTLEDAPLKILRLLLLNQHRYVKHEEIEKELGRFTGVSINADKYKTDIKKLRDLLVEAGMPKSLRYQVIKLNKKTGYRIMA